MLVKREQKIALTIAGSDPTGGAGIQLDLKIFSAFGILPLTAVTAVTAQSSTKVTKVLPVPAKILKEQLKLLISEFPIGAVKVGMLATEENVVVVSDLLKKIKGIPVIVDPVLASSSNKELLESKAIGTFVKKIVPFSTILTPNLPEARILSEDINGELTHEKLAKKIAAMGCNGVLIKGGHSEGFKIVDTFLFNGTIYNYSHKKIEGNFHGTGCALSSAIASFILKGYDTLQAVRYAVEYLQRVMRNSKGFKILQIKKPFIKGIIKG